MTRRLNHCVAHRGMGRLAGSEERMRRRPTCQGPIPWLHLCLLLPCISALVLMNCDGPKLENRRGEDPNSIEDPQRASEHTVSNKQGEARPTIGAPEFRSEEVPAAQTKRESVDELNGFQSIEKHVQAMFEGAPDLKPTEEIDADWSSSEQPFQSAIVLSETLKLILEAEPSGCTETFVGGCPEWRSRLVVRQQGEAEPVAVLDVRGIPGIEPDTEHETPRPHLVHHQQFLVGDVLYAAFVVSYNHWAAVNSWHGDLHVVAVPVDAPAEAHCVGYLKNFVGGQHLWAGGGLWWGGGYRFVQTDDGPPGLRILRFFAHSESPPWGYCAGGEDISRLVPDPEDQRYDTCANVWQETVDLTLGSESSECPRFESFPRYPSPVLTEPYRVLVVLEKSDDWSSRELKELQWDPHSGTFEIVGGTKAGVESVGAPQKPDPGAGTD